MGIGVYVPEFKISISGTAETVAAIIGLQWVEGVRPERVVVVCIQ